MPLESKNIPVFVSFLICLCCLAVINLFKADKIIENPHRHEQTTKFSQKSVWTLYYGGWGSPDDWQDWKKAKSEHEKYFYQPPDNIPSIYYPQMGTYCSHNETVILEHLKMIKNAGIDAIIIPWIGYLAQTNFQHASFVKKTIELLFKHAHEYSIKIGILLDYYTERKEIDVIKSVTYYIDTYANHQSILKINDKPLVIIYDAQKMDSSALMFRQFKNVEFYATAPNWEDFLGIYEDGYSGFVSYYASDGFTWGSTLENWNLISENSKKRDIEFVPTVAPGYDDHIINLWNSRQKKSRLCDQYYNNMWRTAFEINPPIILINSFNNWVEGTSIEPAISKDTFVLNKDNWCGNEPQFYMERTAKYIKTFKTKEE